MKKVATELYCYHRSPKPHLVSVKGHWYVLVPEYADETHVKAAYAFSRTAKIKEARKNG